MIMAADKQDKVLNVPTLRFPEFSGEWEKYKLGDIMEFTKVRISSSLLTAVNYVSTENMLQDFQGVTCAHNVPEDTNVMEYKQGDVLVSNIRPYLKKVWKADKDGGCSADVFVMRANRNVCTDDFLHHIVANDRFIGYVMNGAKGVKMPRGDKEQMKGFKTALPSLKEQQKVAHLLAIINERIITQIRIIEDLKSERKYLLEQLFCLPNERAPKLRLKGMTGEWQKVKLCYIANRVTEKNKANTCNRVLTIAAQYGLIDQQEFFNKQIASSDLTTYYLLHKGDFAYNKSYSGDYSWGAVKRLDKYDKGVLSSLYICFRPNENVDSDFLCHYFESTKWYRGISEISGEGARNHGLLNMSVDDYFNTLHRIPTLREQKAVANALNVLVDKIDIETEILNDLQKQKSYLLKEMFI